MSHRNPWFQWARGVSRWRLGRRSAIYVFAHNCEEGILRLAQTHLGVSVNRWNHLTSNTVKKCLISFYHLRRCTLVWRCCFHLECQLCSCGYWIFLVCRCSVALNGQQHLYNNTWIVHISFIASRNLLKCVNAFQGHCGVMQILFWTYIRIAKPGDVISMGFKTKSSKKLLICNYTITLRLH